MDGSRRCALPGLWGEVAWDRLGFVGLVAVLAIACSSQSPDAVDAGGADSDAGATADSTLPTGADADAQAEVASDPGPTGPEAECLAMVLPCWKFSWVNGNCVQVPINGPNCEEVPTPCETPKGSACARTSANPCFESSGTCSEEGFCVASPKPGAPCSISTSPCGMGICTDQGKCLPVAVGEPCATQVGVCQVGRCDAKGACTAESLPEGTTCTVAAPKTCQSTSGKCDAAAKCVADAATGAVCKIAAPKDCEGPSGKCDAAAKCVADVTIGAKCKVGGTVCGTGTCNSSGGCDAQVFAAAGTSCGINVGCGVPTCDGSGNCLPGKAAVGTPCGSTSPITCSKHTCNAAGQCVLGPATGEVCSVKGGPYCFLPTFPECQQPVCSDKLGYFDLVPTPTKACTLPMSASPECAVGVCKEGACTVVAKVGAPCGNNPCETGTCDAMGACIQVPTPGKVCGPEGQCTARICSASGTCAEVATPGKSCPGKTACFAGVCDAAKTCAQIPKPGASCQTIGLCGNGVCNSTGGCVDPVWPDPPACMIEQAGVFGECWTGVKDESGGCKKVAKVGASCGCWASPCSIGTCQADGSCLQKPNKPVGSACSSACVAAGTCSAAGLCVGKVANGAACTPYADSKTSPVSADCALYTCTPDGTCAAIAKSAGVPCKPEFAFTSKPALPPCTPESVCDGLGRCMAKKGIPAIGACTKADPCGQDSSCATGQCLATGPVSDGTACTMGCFSGTCAAGKCGYPGSTNSNYCGTSWECKTNECCGPFGSAELGTGDSGCANMVTGSCVQQMHPNAPCEPQDGCSIGVCSQDGQCFFGKSAFGTPCGSAGPCTGGICYAGQCVNPADYDPSYTYACDDGNPCTAEFAMSKCNCFYSKSGPDGMSCAPGAHCLKGNCVPD